MDDGRGAARSLVLRHRHEQENGRTSAVTMEIMGYAKDGQQVVPTARSHLQRWAEVVNHSDRSVTLIDLCGHEKYLKTTVFGLTGKCLTPLPPPQNPAPYGAHGLCDSSSAGAGMATRVSLQLRLAFWSSIRNVAVD